MSRKHSVPISTPDRATEVSCAIAATPAQTVSSRAFSPHQETSDLYSNVVAQLCDRHRVIVCTNTIQWIVQTRKKGGAERPWRGVGYFRTRDALIRACASLCSRIDPAAMAILVALPTHFGGAA